MPRNPYHYSDTAVKLPGHIVAIATSMRCWIAYSGTLLQVCLGMLKLPAEDRNAICAEKKNRKQKNMLRYIHWKMRFRTTKDMADEL